MNQKDNTPKTFGAYIQTIRTERKLTIRELERISEEKGAKVSAPYISQIESGKRLPSPNIIQKIATSLELDYYDLLAKAGYVQTEDRERWQEKNQDLKTDFTRKELNQLQLLVEDETERMLNIAQHEIVTMIEGMAEEDLEKPLIAKPSVSKEAINYLLYLLNSIREEELEILESLRRKINFKLHPEWNGVDPKDEFRMLLEERYIQSKTQEDLTNGKKTDDQEG